MSLATSNQICWIESHMQRVIFWSGQEFNLILQFVVSFSNWRCLWSVCSGVNGTQIIVLGLANPIVCTWGKLLNAQRSNLQTMISTDYFQMLAQAYFDYLPLVSLQGGGEWLCPTFDHSNDKSLMESTHESYPVIKLILKTWDSDRFISKHNKQLEQNNVISSTAELKLTIHN